MATDTKNIYEKLQAVREEFGKQKTVKSGYNPHAEFAYFELSDIIPTARALFSKHRLFMQTTFAEGYGTATLYDMDSDKTISFQIPIHMIAEPAKFRMNETQAAGAMVTYYRRYLYFLVLDLIENDEIDNEQAPVSAPTKPATKEEREEIKKDLTATEAQADELQITGLKNALKKLKEVAPDSADFIRDLSKKTEKFTNISRSNCEKAILKIQQMIKEIEG